MSWKTKEIEVKDCDVLFVKVSKLMSPGEREDMYAVGKRLRNKGIDLVIHTGQFDCMQAAKRRTGFSEEEISIIIKRLGLMDESNLEILLEDLKRL